MNNLKRVLSVALTGTMLAGMMTIGAGAANKDFTDADEIQHIEAVDVMSTLGVLQGKDTGAFDPTATVTRAEMAKIITVMLNGGVDPTLGSASVSMYSDVPANHWARSYIEYCSNLGIIAGQGDGTFNPEGSVTGAAAAKMLLVALGYDPDVFGFTGIDWELNVNRRANDAKLYDEIKTIDTSAGLSRDNTAQMAYNALEAKVMETTFDKVASSGEITYNYTESTETFLNKYFDAYTFVGQMDGNADTLDGLTDGHIQVTGDLDTADTSVKDYEAKVVNFPSDLDISNVGEEVKVIFKDGKSGSAKRPDKNDTIYGVFNTGKTEVINAIKDDIGNLETDEQKIKVDGTKYGVADTVTVVTNYVGEGTKYTDNQLKGSDDANSALTTALQGTNGDTIKFVCDDNGKINRAYVTESKLAVVTSKNSEKVTINNGVGTLTIADNEVYDNIAKDDVVVITTLYAKKASDDGAYTIVKKAESVSGEVEGYKTTENVVVDGTTYAIKDEKLFTTGIDEYITAFNAADSDYIGEDVTLYMVNGFVAAASQTSESASNYSVVLEVKQNGTAGSTFDALQLRVMDGEGTKTIITVSDDSDAKTTDDYDVGDIITYTLNKDKEAVVTIKNNEAAATEGYVKSTKSFNKLTTTSNCVLFATTETKDGETSNIKAYSIRDLKDVAIAGKTTNYVTNSSNRVVAVYVDLGSKPAGATSSTLYGIISADNGSRKVDSTTYNNYTVQVNGDSYTVNTLETFKKGQIVAIDPTSDNIYSASEIKKLTDGQNAKFVYVDEYTAEDEIISVFTGVKDVTDEDGTVVGKEGTNPATYAVDSDVAIYFVDIDNSKGVESGSVAHFDEVNGYKNAMLVFGSDKETVEVIIVEVSGEGNIGKNQK